MKSFISRWIVNVIAIAAIAWLLPGITVGEPKWLTVLLVALIFGLVNAVIKPLFSLVTCGLYVLTLGLFTFIANALMLMATGYISRWVGLQFQVNGFWTAALGALIISLVSFTLSVVGKKIKAK